MERKINIEISNPDKFISDIENNNFIQIPSSYVWDLGYNIEAYHEYSAPENFPFCCENHTQIMKELKTWFDKFPECCDNHKSLKSKKWFKKEIYKDVPIKVVKAIDYSSSFIKNNLEKDNWYKEITDYIEYILYSFGTPNIGGNWYFLILQKWVQTDLKLEPNIEWKRHQLLDFFEEIIISKEKKKTNKDLNLLSSTFKNWIKFIPNIPVFSSIKTAYKGKLPMNLFLYDGEHNRFTGLTKYKSRTKSELIEILVNHTKNILEQLTSSNVYKNLKVSDKEKYEIEVITEKHKIEQLSLLNNHSKGEKLYIKTLKKWLQNEKDLISELKPIYLNKYESKDFHNFLINEIYFFGQNLEKLKRLHNSFEEEDFRDYFLPHLTTISKSHITTGETFNKIGKTDILVQDLNGQNKFIGECKLWKGEAYLNSAIDQLIERYVLWRDEKAALIIFNKENKDFTNVINVAKKTLEKHNLFDSILEEKYETVITYKFKHHEDENRLLTLELLLFNCYRN